MSRIVKRILSAFLASAVAFSTGVIASASEIPSSVKSVQSIIETVNHEYGVDFYIPDETDSKECKKSLQISSASSSDVGVISESAIRSANLSSSQLKEFESELRQAAKLISKENAESNAAQKNAAVSENKSIKDSSSVQSEGIRLAKSGKKTITGGIAHFEGWANNYKGYWVWEYCNTASADMDYNNNKYRFAFEDYSDTIIDSGRTCGVTYKGTLYTKTLAFWVPSKSSQYVEWWAGMAA